MLTARLLLRAKRARCRGEAARVLFLSVAMLLSVNAFGEAERCTANSGALAADSALQKQFGTDNGGILTGSPHGSQADAWPFGQALAGSLDMAALTGNDRNATNQLKGLPFYQAGAAYAPTAHPSKGESRFYDDNGWIGLDLVQAYAQTKDHAYLDRAENLYTKFIKTGIERDGGVHWQENPGKGKQQRNGPATGSNTELALQLYLSTCDAHYLDDARKTYAFMENGLRQPDGLYIDHINDDSSKDGAIYTYNQGTAIGADLLMFKATGNTTFLDRAKQTAAAALDYFGQDDRMWTSPPAFNAIFFRNLMALNAVAPNATYGAALDAYLGRLWSQARDPMTGLFDKGGVGQYGKSKGKSEAMQLVDQGAIVQMFALAGKKGCPATRLDDLLGGGDDGKSCTAKGSGASFLRP